MPSCRQNKNRSHVRLALDGPHPGLLSGVRSTGKDGVFEGTSNTPGAVPTAQHERDLVWLDGKFVTWPKHTTP